MRHIPGGNVSVRDVLAHWLPPFPWFPSQVESDIPAVSLRCVLLTSIENFCVPASHPVEALTTESQLRPSTRPPGMI